ncbi:MAG: hypothetical protein QM723_34085 [Myxococcaceae bacterium]
MRRRLIWPVVAAISLGCGLGEYKRARERDVHRCFNTVPVVVAAHRIARGAHLGFEDLSQRALPEQFVRRNDVRPDELTRISELTPVRTLEEGEPIAWLDLGLIDEAR